MPAAHAYSEEVNASKYVETRHRSALFASPAASADAAVLTRDFAARDDCTALSLSCRRPRCGRASTQRGTPRGGSLAAPALLPGLLRRVHLPARSRRSRPVPATAAQARGKAERGRGIPRHRSRARRAGAAGARRGGGCAPARRPRAGQAALRAGPRGDDRAGSAQPRGAGARAASRRDGRPPSRRSRGPRAASRIPPSAPASSGSTRASSAAKGDREQAARYARDALALLEYADDLHACVARRWQRSRSGDGW